MRVVGFSEASCCDNIVTLKISHFQDKTIGGVGYQLLSTVVLKWLLFYLQAQKLLNELKLDHKKEQNKLSERSV